MFYINLPRFSISANDNIANNDIKFIQNFINNNNSHIINNVIKELESLYINCRCEKK